MDAARSQSSRAMTKSIATRNVVVIISRLSVASVPACYWMVWKVIGALSLSSIPVRTSETCISPTVLESSR